MKEKLKLPLLSVITVIILLITLLTGSNLKRAVQAQSVAEIKERGELIVATSADYAPYEFQILKSGKNKIVGLDIDLAEKIADHLGVKLRIDNMKFDSILVAIQSGKADLGMAGFTKSPEREKSADLSDPYFEASQVIVINKNEATQYQKKADFAGQQIVVQQGTVQEKIIKEQIPEAKIITVDEIPNGILQVQSEQVAGMALDSSVAQGYIENNNDLVYSKQKLKNIENGANVVIMPKGSPTLKQQINLVINRLKNNGTIDKLFQKNSKLQGSQVKADQSKSEESAGLNFNFLPKDLAYFIDGALVTIIIAAAVVFCGVILGTIIALMKLAKNKFLHLIAGIYVEILRGTPMLLQILVWFAILKLTFPTISIGILDVDLGRLSIGIFALSLNSGAYISEVIRGGIQAVDSGQKEAAYSLGLRPTKTMRYIIFPQALKNILPALGNEFITILKDSSLLTTIGITELLWGANAVKAATYQSLSPLLVAGGFYLVMTFILSRLFAWYEKKLAN